MAKDVITLAHGSGGREMQELIRKMGFEYRGGWLNCDDDSATLSIGGGRVLAFTSDSYTVDPLFFPGGDIGRLAVCGTVNDLAVMGAEPKGLSLALVLEEGFPQEDFDRVIKSVKKASSEAGVPVVTGDTKVMEKGKIDKLVVNTSGVGIASKDEILDKRPKTGDSVIVSGGIGEHAVALLSKRFDYETDIVSDSKPIIGEILVVRRRIKAAKDPTRGGIAAALNELCLRFRVGMLVDEDSIPMKPQVGKVAQMLGLNPYELACEGRFVCVASNDNAEWVVKRLRRFNKEAAIVGSITGEGGVTLQTIVGQRTLSMPSGRIVPRIC